MSVFFCNFYYRFLGEPWFADSCGPHMVWLPCFVGFWQSIRICEISVSDVCNIWKLYTFGICKSNLSSILSRREITNHHLVNNSLWQTYPFTVGLKRFSKTSMHIYELARLCSTREVPQPAPDMRCIRGSCDFGKNAWINGSMKRLMCSPNERLFRFRVYR